MIWSNRFGLPEPIVRAIKNDTYVKVGDISVTGLISPPQMRVLMKRHSTKITKDVSDSIYALLGQSVHAVLERAAPENVISERRMTAEVGGWVISGQPDLYESHVAWGGLLSDYKLTTVWNAQQEEKREWTEQVNSYAWFYRKQGIQVDRAQIIAIMRDWKKGMAVDPSYPQVGVRVINVPLWDNEVVERFLAQRVALHRNSELLKDADLPACSKDDRWIRDEKWAVKKPGAKKAMPGGVFDNPTDAKLFLGALEEAGGSAAIEYRPGEAVRCESWCDVRPFCKQYAATLPRGLEAAAISKP